MINDITFLDEAQFGEIGSQKFLVDANESGQGTGATYVPAFRTGEPVFKSLGNATDANFVHTLAAIGTGSTAKPVVATDFMVGIAAGGQAAFSTETDTVDGFVYVVPMVPNVIYLGIPDTASSWNTQAKYDLLVGSRVLMSMSASTSNPAFTILASDSATSGLVIAPLDITKYPGKVAFYLRQGLNFTV